MRFVNLVSIRNFAALGILSTSLVSAQFYKTTNLVSDIAGRAPTHDPHLVNPWGVSFAPGGPWWVSDNGTGLSTLYDGSGQIVNLVVTIPPASGTGMGSPTGTVYQPKLGAFLFVTLDGTISEWTGGSSAVIKATKAGASYTGATLATRKGETLLYVANAAGGVDVYDQNFKPVALGAGAFKDSKLPANVTPYNIQTLGTDIYVTYSGAGGGFVDAFDVNGVLKLRFESGSFLSAPWGLALAPTDFGKFSGDFLVGNLGSGRIAAFGPKGHFAGFLLSAVKKPIAIPDLWAIAFGNGGAAGPTSTLFFAAGIQQYAHGLFGSITVAP